MLFQRSNGWKIANIANSPPTPLSIVCLVANPILLHTYTSNKAAGNLSVLFNLAMLRTTSAPPSAIIYMSTPCSRRSQSQRITRDSLPRRFRPLPAGAVLLGQFLHLLRVLGPVRHIL